MCDIFTKGWFTSLFLKVDTNATYANATKNITFFYFCAVNAFTFERLQQTRHECHYIYCR